MCIVKRYDPLIQKAAWACLRKCADGHTTFEDLHQEGRIVLTKLLQKRFKKDRAKFSTQLMTCLINRYAKIVRESYVKKRINLIYSDPNDLDMESGSNPYEEVRKQEVLEEIKKINPALANLFIDGVPEELFIRARNRSRSIALKRKQKSNKITIDRSLIEKYYGISVKKIIETLEKVGV